MSDHTQYESPLNARYASREMSYLFSKEYRHRTWRRLWTALARCEKALGLPITDAQINALETNIHNIDFERIAEIEKELRHDVMAHIQAYGEVASSAKPIIHLGATSAFVTDNTDLIQMHEALKLLRPKLVEVLRHLSQFAQEYKDLPCLGFTHLQAAQPTTLGKRACLWLQDLMVDLDDLEEQLLKMRFLGIKGATGTQASFLELFHGDKTKVQRLDEMVAREMGFSKLYTIASQTYPRKQDIKIIAVLSGIAASSHKFATDIRLLAHMKEVEEPFGDAQVGSSAMPYKRNPMRCERICGLARFLFSLSENPAHTAANQWLERTLDDSSNRRLVIPEAFLVADAILNLLVDVTSHLIVHPKVIQKHLMEELPFLISENILMAAVKKGKDRGTLHERLRLHSLAASRSIKIEGQENNFLALVAEDPSFGLSQNELSSITSASHFTGLASTQVELFLSQDLRPLLKKYHDLKPYIPNIQV